MQIFIDDLHLIIGLDVAGSHFALTGCVNINGLHTVAVHFRNNSLDVQNDLGNVFLDAGDRRKLVLNACDLDRGRSRSGQRGQENPSQGVAQGHTVASFQRFYDKYAMGRIFGRVNTLNARLINFYHITDTLLINLQNICSAV